MAGDFSFVDGNVPSASDWNGNVRDQLVTVCTSSTRPSAPITGRMIYETDTGLVRTYSGSAWVIVAGDGTERTWTPTWANITTPGTTNTGKYWQVGTMTLAIVNGTWASPVTPSGTPVTFTLPRAAAAAAVGNSCAGQLVWRNSGGTYATADAVFLPSTTTATLMSSAFAYQPNTGHSVSEVYGSVLYLTAN